MLFFIYISALIIVPIVSIVSILPDNLTQHEKDCLEMIDCTDPIDECKDIEFKVCNPPNPGR